MTRVENEIATYLVAPHGAQYVALLTSHRLLVNRRKPARMNDVRKQRLALKRFCRIIRVKVKYHQGMSILLIQKPPSKQKLKKLFNM